MLYPDMIPTWCAVCDVAFSSGDTLILYVACGMEHNQHEYQRVHDDCEDAMRSIGMLNGDYMMRADSLAWETV